MSVDVVLRSRKLCSVITEYREYSRTTWRWRWMAYLFSPPFMSVRRDKEGNPHILQCVIEPTPT